MIFQTITYTQANGLGVLTLNRPEVMNALNTAMRFELCAALERAVGSVRALVLTGADRAHHLASDPTAAYAALKQALRDRPGNDLAAQLAVEAAQQGQCGRSDDFREGVAAFLEKRPARFTGY